MKVKQFWVPDKHLYATATECLKMWPKQAAALCFSSAHIEWEKVWNGYDSKNWTPRLGAVGKEEIQVLVEKALRGEL